MVSFGIGEEIEKHVFVVQSRVWNKENILSPHKESNVRAFGFRAPMPYHWATETLNKVISITKFIYDKRPACLLIICGSVTERGIRRSEVRFLVETQNFFLCLTLVTRRNKLFSKFILDTKKITSILDCQLAVEYCNRERSARFSALLKINSS